MSALRADGDFMNYKTYVILCILIYVIRFVSNWNCVLKESLKKLHLKKVFGYRKVTQVTSTVQL